MAFKGLRFAGLEIKNMLASRAVIVVLAAIALIPCLYGALYLWAFQDPYHTLSDVPVAVVNNDAGAVIAGEDRNIGAEVCDDISTHRDGMQWNFVTAEEAQAGIEAGTYYMICTIPEDFSEKVASAETPTPERAQLTVTYDESANVLASQIGETVWQRVQAQVNESISAQYWQVVLDKTNNAGHDIADAAEGSQALADGLTSVADGSVMLQEGVGALATGVGGMQQGLNGLAQGAGALDSGMGALSSQSSALVGGADALAQGTNALVPGLEALQSQGSAGLVQGMAGLKSGMDGLNTAFNSTDMAEPGLVMGTQALSRGIEGVGTNLAGLSTNLAGIPNQAATIGTHVQTMTGYQQSLESMNTLLLADAAKIQQGSEALRTVASASGELTLAQQDAAQVSSHVAATKTSVDDAIKALSEGAYADDPAVKQVIETLKTAQTENADAANALGNTTAHIQEAGTRVGLLTPGLADVEQGVTDWQTHATRATTDVTGVLTESQSVADVAGQLATTAGQSAGGLQMAASVVQSGLTPMAQGVAAGVAQVGTLFNPLTPMDKGGIYAAVALLYDGADQMNTALLGVNAGMAPLAQGAQGLAAGVTGYTAGVDGIAQATGALSTGASTLSSMVPAFSQGVSGLQTGVGQLGEGLTMAADGNQYLADQLAEGSQGMKMSHTVMDAKSEVMSAPVELKSDYYTSVKNYGTGFAPYFISLGLWVGCLVAGFVFKPLSRRMIMSGCNPVAVAFAGFMPHAAFALIQAIILLAVLQFGLQLQIDNVLQYYAFGMLAAITFAAIMQLLTALLGFAGKFVAIILLMLQLTSCAGTFPLETTPVFFQVISDFMPMTYAVEGMRQIMTGIGFNLALQDAGILFLVGVACFALTSWVAYRKRDVTMEELHPAVQLS